MTTCRSVVNGALRKLGRLGAGREPRTADRTDALAALQGLYLSWVSSGAFGRLNDIIAVADMTAGENQRIIREVEATKITLPEFVPAYRNPLPYGVLWPSVVENSVDYNHRPPKDGATVQIQSQDTGNVVTWVYDGVLRKWVQIESLQLDDEAPRSRSDPEGLSALLATELGDMFGADLGPTTINQARRFLETLTSRFSMPRRETAGVYI